jgi:hypothetical protein
MGGHGALTLYLSSLVKTKQYRSASAFAPITNPTKSPWGVKAFTGYLQGGIEEAKATYDVTELIARESKLKNEKVNILIDHVFSQILSLVHMNSLRINVCSREPVINTSVNFGLKTLLTPLVVLASTNLKYISEAMKAMIMAITL